VATAAPDETVRAASERMAEFDVGTLVVVDGQSEKPVGIVTDRDVTIRCLAGGHDPDQTHLKEIMSSPVHSVDEHTPTEEGMSRMAAAGVRRVVVTGPEGVLMGLFSLDDALDLVVEEVTTIGRLLEKQAPKIAI
jgi:CBS domain-containing protein